jgi:hypothetical protein
VRLAVLADRAKEARERRSGLVTLDDLVTVTSMHEEGHLCDRTRFFPLEQHVMRALGFLFKCGFSASAVAERLEYRAQLVALCEAPEPRIPLSDILRAAERVDDGVTPHARAYRRLLADFLDELDREMDAEPEAWTAIDSNRVLVQELHRLAPEQIRIIARKLARVEGLFEK